MRRATLALAAAPWLALAAPLAAAAPLVSQCVDVPDQQVGAPGDILQLGTSGVAVCADAGADASAEPLGPDGMAVLGLAEASERANVTATLLTPAPVPGPTYVTDQFIGAQSAGACVRASLNPLGLGCLVVPWP